MHFLQQARNSVIGKSVLSVLDTLKRGGQFFDCTGNDLRELSFAFPEYADGVFNVTLERSVDRKNWGFWGSGVSIDGQVRHYARCVSEFFDFEVVEDASIPGKQLFFRNGCQLGSCSLQSSSISRLSGFVPRSWNLSTSFAKIGTVSRRYASENAGLYIDTEEWGRLSLDAQTLKNRGNFFKELLYTLSFSWLTVEPQKNSAYAIPVDWPEFGNVDVEQVLFLMSLLFETDSFLLSMDNNSCDL